MAADEPKYAVHRAILNSDGSISRRKWRIMDTATRRDVASYVFESDAREALRNKWLREGPEVEVAKAYVNTRNGMRPDGWDVLVNGEWHDRFRLKREAVACAKAL